MKRKFDNSRPIIGLNGRFLVAQRTGVQRSAYRLFRSIVEQGDRFNFYLFTGISELFAPEWDLPNVIVVGSDISQTTTLRNHAWEQFELPRLAQKHGVALLHSPANVAPVFCSVPSVVNIHDVCFLVEPAWFSPSFRFIYSWLVPRIAKRAASVITNSNNSKNDILELLGVDINNLRLVYWAVEPLFFDYNQPYLEREDRILFVGSLEPRKNLGGLLKAFNLFRERNPTLKTRLSVVGCESSLFAQSHYERGKYHSDVDFVGYVSDRELAGLYGSSKMLVYPSFYEGFGFPPLEAMAAGTPVITSNNSSLPEVVGNSSILVDPADITDLAIQMERLALNTDLAITLAQRGLERVKKFSWDHVGQHVLSIYDEILARK